MANFCKTCHYYEGAIFTRAGESFGICHNIIPALKIVQDLPPHFIMGEDAILYTQEYFGCVYHRKEETAVFTINDILTELHKRKKT